MKTNKNARKIKVTENDFKDFSSIATIPEHFEKSMVLYITTRQKMPDDNQKDTMSTKPEWFIEFENKQENVENIEHRLDKLESRINNLIVKNNLKK